MKTLFLILAVCFSLSLCAQESVHKGMTSHLSVGSGVISSDQYGGGFYDACFNVGYCFNNSLSLTGGLHYLDMFDYQIRYAGPNLITTYYLGQNKIKPFIGLKTSWNFRFMTNIHVKDDLQCGLHAGLSFFNPNGKCDYALYLSHEYIGLNHHEFKNAVMLNFSVNPWSEK